MKPKEKHIIILSGQSNAGGVARYKLLKGKIEYNRLQSFYHGFDNVQINYWSTGAKNLSFQSVKIIDGLSSCDQPFMFGPEIGFAETISKNAVEPVYIAKWAYGGASLDFDYCPPSANKEYDKCAVHGEPQGWCYEGLTQHLDQIIERIEKDGSIPVIDCFMWMQGEADACEQCINRYEEKFLSLINDLKNRYSKYLNKDFAVIDAGICEDTWWQLAKEENEIKRGFASKIQNYVFIDTQKEGLTTKYEPIEEPDVSHYDSLSMLKLGHLFGEVYLKLFNK